jgi:GMP reductase
MKIKDGIQLDFDDVLIRPQRSSIESRGDVDVNRTFVSKWSKCTITGFPFIVANMDTVGVFKIAEVLSEYGAFVALHKHYSNRQLIDFYNKTGVKNFFFTIGQSEKELNNLVELSKDIPINMINCDVANAHTHYFVKHIISLREKFPKSFLMAGNICIPEMAQQLIDNGADCVKVGIGPGSACTTRLKTGVGLPQISAIIDCKDAAHCLDGLVCADGGCKNSGDVAKAFGAGADFVMAGGLFAGVDECEGDWETNNSGQKTLKFYGMSSKEAQDKYNGGLATYKAAEGRCVAVAGKGPCKDVILDIMGGVRSACAYVGSRKLKDFDKCCTFVRVNNTHNRIFEK